MNCVRTLDPLLCLTTAPRVQCWGPGLVLVVDHSTQDPASSTGFVCIYWPNFCGICSEYLNDFPVPVQSGGWFYCLVFLPIPLGHMGIRQGVPDDSSILYNTTQYTSQKHLKTLKVVFLQLLDLREFQKSQRISLYLNMRDEIQTTDLLQQLLLAKKDCFIPHYSGSNMKMVRIQSWDDYVRLPETKWKIKQPDDSDVRENALDTGKAYL